MKRHYRTHHLIYTFVFVLLFVPMWIFAFEATTTEPIIIETPELKTLILLGETAGTSTATSTEQEEEVIVVVEVPSPVMIRLTIESLSGTIFNKELTVTACSPDASSTPVVSGYCAVIQTGLPNTWSTYGGLWFLDSIDGLYNDYQNGFYWGWFSDLAYGQTSLDEHMLSASEYLIITLGKMPLISTVSTTTPDVGSTLSVAVTQFGFDDSWNGIWLPSASSTVHANGQVYETDGTGAVMIPVASSTPFTLHATKEGFIESDEVLVFPQASFEESSSTQNSDTSSGGGGGRSVKKQCEFDVPLAVAFLASKQKANGSFGADLYTDWTAIALSAVGNSTTRNKVTSYIQSRSSTLLSATDYERHAMALMALGVDPYTGTDINYIEKIIEQFDGTQVGEASLVNDDIFALFPLLKGGYDESDDIINDIISFILSEQKSDGSWEGSIDLTASAVQALVEVSSLEGVSASLDFARTYLSESQRDDGGFGSSFATSWVLQALTALDEQNSNWKKNGLTPENALCALQQEDGGIESVESPESTRVWATAYAIPAVLGIPWTEILSSFSESPSTAGQNTQKETTVEILDTVDSGASFSGMVLGTSTVAEPPETVWLEVPAIPQAGEYLKKEDSPSDKFNFASSSAGVPAEPAPSEEPEATTDAEDKKSKKSPFAPPYIIFLGVLGVLGAWYAFTPIKKNK